MKKTSEYYDEFSARYERGRSRGYHALVDELEAGAIIPCAVGKRVLEAGCGTGLIMDRLRRAGAAAFGADLSHGMLTLATGRGLRVVQADIRALPFKDETFDVVYSFKVLAHVKDAGKAVSEMVRVSRKGGHIFPEFYNRRSLRFLVRVSKGARHISERTTDRELYTRYDRWREMVSMVPPSCRLEGARGVRIWTFLPFMIKIPILGKILSALERISSESPLKKYAGFIILKLRRME